MVQGVTQIYQVRDGMRGRCAALRLMSHRAVEATHGGVRRAVRACAAAAVQHRLANVVGSSQGVWSVRVRVTGIKYVL